MARYVVDSDTLSYVLQRKGHAIARFAEAVRARAEIYLCPVVYYQIRRGLLDKGAVRQLQEFRTMVGNFLWADIDRSMWDDAAEIWVACRRRGRPHEDDADLLIAAYARHLQATLVTNNTADFEDLGLRLANWVM